MANLALSASLGLDAFEAAPLELRPNFTEDDLQLIIGAVYRQVLGNIHVMDSQRLESAEALLRNGDITVKGFVRAVAQSELYRSLYFDGSSPYRSIELNFKHLLGRAPNDQAEIIEHVLIYNSQGYEADINSYLDSEEYDFNFSEYTVPYPRNIITRTGSKTESFNRTLAILRGSPTSDLGQPARLTTSVAANAATPIKLPAKGAGGSYNNTGKKFKISYSTSKAPAQLLGYSNQSCTTTFDNMCQTVQNILRSGGKIVSIAES